MLKTAIILGAISIAVVLSDFCRHESGSWSGGTVDGANDFGTTGLSPNDKYFCWEACLNSAFVNQNFKVLLANPQAPRTPRRLMSSQELRARAMKIDRSVVTGHDEDPNADSCMDPVLRADVKNALLKVTNNSAIAVARTIQYEVARANWVYNVVEMAGGLAGDGYYTDMNFCLYIADMGDELYDIRLAAIDKS